jgi:hypothetical protein
MAKTIVLCSFILVVLLIVIIMATTRIEPFIPEVLPPTPSTTARSEGNNNNTSTKDHKMLKNRAIQRMKSIFRNFNHDNFNTNKLSNYHVTFVNKSILFNILNDNYDMQWSVDDSIKDKNRTKFALEMMNNVQSLMRKEKTIKPPLVVCISFEDYVPTYTETQYIAPVIYNSNNVHLQHEALLSPLWWFFMKDKLQDIIRRGNTIPFREKKPKAIWRGSTTGDGNRMKLVDFARRHEKYIDAKFNNFCDLYADLAKIYPKAEYMDPKDQIKYRYILSLDGNGGTYGLYWQLLSGSCLLVSKRFNQWFSPFFEPGIHYIPFDENDGEDLLNKIVTTSEQTAETIAQNCRKRALEVFNITFITWYMHELLHQLNKHQY